MQTAKPGWDEMYCPSCGAIVKRQAEVCVKCGAFLPGAPSAARRLDERAVETWICPKCGRKATARAGQSPRYNCKECGGAMSLLSVSLPPEALAQATGQTTAVPQSAAPTPAEKLPPSGVSDPQATETQPSAAEAAGGGKPGWDEMYCSSCGAIIKRQAEICIKCGVRVNKPAAAKPAVEYSDKSRLAAGLLGIFLGSIGIHRFYLGYTGIGIIQILVTIFTLGIGSIWGLIEGIIIVAGGNWKDARGLPLKKYSE